MYVYAYTHSLYRSYDADTRAVSGCYMAEPHEDDLLPRVAISLKYRMKYSFNYD